MNLSWDDSRLDSLLPKDKQILFRLDSALRDLGYDGGAWFPASAGGNTC